MSEIGAAMGLTLLDDLDALIAVNSEHYRLYRERLRDVAGIGLMRYDETLKSNYQYVVLEVDESITGICAADLMAVLRAENVFARRYFYPGCHRMEPYRSEMPEASRHLPETERLATRVLCLPTGTGVGADEIDTICQILRLAIGA